MENQEEKETSLEYFFRITKNNAINLGRLIEAYVDSRKIYDMEIEEAKKEGYKKGYQDSIRIKNQQIVKTYRALVIIFSVFSALTLGKLIYSFITYLNK